MSAALTQQRAVEIAREHGADLGCNEDAAVIMWPTELHAAMEQYHREASQQESVEPVAWLYEQSA